MTLWELIQDIFGWGDFNHERLGGAMRASDWSTWRKQHVKDRCDFCGTKGTVLSPLELHHVLPFHLFPHLEKDKNNVVTGCRKCHLEFFHLGSFKSYNKDIKEDIIHWQDKVKNRP